MESISWYFDGIKFISVYGDGSFIKWLVEGSLEILKVVIFLGFFFCKVIIKVEWSDFCVFFSGGMFRVSYGDRYCVLLI